MLLEMKDIVKVYGQVVANDHVSFSPWIKERSLLL